MGEACRAGPHSAEIPADAQGRFIDERGNMFQSYYSEYGDDVFAPIENREAHR